MNIKPYLKTLKEISDKGGKFICPYCGAETQSLDSSFFCSYCENFVQGGTQTRLSKRIQEIRLIRSKIKNREYDDVYTKYESLPDYQTSPELIYSEALVYIEHSNYESSQISYMRKGFMEENAIHRNNSIKLFSTARFLLNKSISVAKKELQNSENEFYKYTMFLAYLKLNDLKAAEYTLKRMHKSEKTQIVEYASMLLESTMGSYDKVLLHANELISKSNPPVNAVYYIAYALFKKNNYKEAMQLLNALPYKKENYTVEALANQIKYMQTS